MNKQIENELIEYAMQFEGYWSEDPDDPGGATKFGIILPTLRAMGLAGDFDNDGDIDVGDLKAMTREEAVEVYRTVMLKPMRLDLLNKSTTFQVCAKYFDTRVNMGPYQASLILQRAINAVVVATTSFTLGVDTERVPLDVDGIVGKATRLELEYMSQPAAQYLPALMACEQAGVYRLIVQRKPTLKKFLQGWLRRAYSQYGSVIARADGLA